MNTTKKIVLLIFAVGIVTTIFWRSQSCAKSRIVGFKTYSTPTKFLIRKAVLENGDIVAAPSLPDQTVHVGDSLECDCHHVVL